MFTWELLGMICPCSYNIAWAPSYQLVPKLFGLWTHLKKCFTLAVTHYSVVVMVIGSQCSPQGADGFAFYAHNLNILHNIKNWVVTHS